MNIFSLGGSGPNPLTTEIGQLIGNYISNLLTHLSNTFEFHVNNNNNNIEDKATDLIGSETSVGLFFEICDLIEEKEEK